METKKQTFDKIENSIYQLHKEDLLKHSEVYFILDLVRRLVDKNEEINKLKA